MVFATVGDPLGKFTGLDNLMAILDDDIFKRALANTFIFTLTSQALQMVFGTLLAFLLLKKFRGRRIVRALKNLRGKQLTNPWKKHDNIPL